MIIQNLPSSQKLPTSKGMCYDIAVTLQRQLKAAKRINDEKIIQEIIAKIEKFETSKYHHVSGFTHPTVLIYTNESPTVPVFSQWGLIPHWSKSEEEAKKFWNNTLNARGETIFEKPSFRESAKSKRCLIYIDGFFEHHHFNGKAYPFFIQRKNGEMMCLGGLWSEWLNQLTGEIVNTFSIITTNGNEAMSIIHNNPKMKEARMPFVLKDGMEDVWLELDATDSIGEEEILKLISPCPSEEFDYYNVGSLRGKSASGNSESAVKKFEGNPELWITNQALAEI